MARWRIGRNWPEADLRSYLDELPDLAVNFNTQPEHMTAANGWTVDGADQRIGYEPSGPPLPNGLFTRAKDAVAAYEFSDRSIVTSHFDRAAPLLGRDMLLEIKVLCFVFLNGVRVRAVRDESDGQRTSFGFRYDTLEGHMERGFEWFLLSKRHETGEVRFRIQAHWRPGDFPNWWSRLGFLMLEERLRERWRRLAVRKLRELSRSSTSAEEIHA